MLASFIFMLAVVAADRDVSNEKYLRCFKQKMSKMFRQKNFLLDNQHVTTNERQSEI